MKRLLLVALMTLVTLVGMVGFSRAAEDPATQSVTPVIGNVQLSLDAISNDQINVVSALQATANATTEAVGTLEATVNAGVPAKAKMYYLTVTSFTGGGAIGACDSGFHMASISEIQDPSNLQYVTSTPVYDSIVDDQGLGQPSNRMGWVRTGPYPMTVSPYTCDVSMTRSGQQSGTTMSRRSLSDGTSWWHTTNPGVVHSARVCLVRRGPSLRSAICTGTIDQQGGDSI